MSVAPFRSSIESAFRKDTRKLSLNLRPHFVPITKKSLSITLKHVFNTLKEVETQGYGQAYNIHAIYSGLVKYINTKSNLKNIDVLNLPDNFLETLDTGFPYAVYYGNELQGILFKSYDRAYDGLFREYLNKALLPYFRESRYDNTKISKGVDVGHIIYGDVASTPLYQKLINLKQAIDQGLSLASGNNITNIQKTVDEAIDKLKSKSSYGRRIVATFKKDFDKFLLSVNANIVIIQDRLENQYFYGNQIEGQIEAEITRELKKLNFSNNLLQEIHSRAVASLTGVKTPDTKKVVQAKDITLANRVKVTSKTTKTKTTPFVPNSMSRIRTSSINLLAILQAGINKQVAKNMGQGNEHRVLNYRTGRFAESVQVQRLSESRQGMITAFYSYMRNPYGTFSEGGRQQLPKSRDPKLLISKSVRELAAPIVGARMRAVLV